MIICYMVGAIAYINRMRNDVKSLHYVDYQHIAVNKNTDPIYKKAVIQVNGENYQGFSILKTPEKD